MFLCSFWMKILPCVRDKICPKNSTAVAKINQIGTRQPMVTPRALPPLEAMREAGISSCSMVSGGGLPHPSLANQYSTYHADLGSMLGFYCIFSINWRTYGDFDSTYWNFRKCFGNKKLQHLMNYVSARFFSKCCLGFVEPTTLMKTAHILDILLQATDQDLSN
jgi:hypothetical protein